MPLPKRKRKMQRHLLVAGTPAVAARAPRATSVVGPVAVAWLEAVEGTLVPAVRALVRRRLPDTRTRRVTFTAGVIQAEIRQASHRSQIATIRVPVADEALWHAVLDVAARHARWLAALAAGDLEADLAAALVDAGIVPAASELAGQCSCRSEGRACVHTGLLGTIAARALSAEPGQMLVVRGMPADRLRARVADRLPGAAGGDTHDPAAVDWDTLFTSEPAPLPEPPAVPAEPGRAAPLPEPPPAAGLTGDDLAALTADAAARALGLLVAGGEAGLDLDADADLARRLAELPAADVRRLAGVIGVAAPELDALGAAWRLGGAAAVGALCRTWHPAPRLLEPGIAAMAATHAGARRRMNRLVSPDGRIELALGRDGLWYLLRRERAAAPLVAAAPGSTDPRALLAAPVRAAAPDGAVPAGAEQLRLL